MGDMTPLFSAYYDTVNAGLKQEPTSYQRIIANEGINPAAWLFLSDNVKGSSHHPRFHAAAG
jgi:enolase-phosphatase E1